MSRDKQNEIHELAKQMSEAISTEVEKRYIEDEAKLQAALIENGWRKASDVAEEIINEFANMLKCHSFYMTDTYGEINENVVTVKAIVEVEKELKKKYTEEEG